ncbi:hypothetical protein [Streptomyces sp. NPDC088725]|uniref:hypothetical protein n=1 Tax=Streptomyces sp. NPDC088725 TaxID=3365873 RepID=UPI003823C8AC
MTEKTPQDGETLEEQPYAAGADPVEAQAGTRRLLAGWRGRQDGNQIGELIRLRHRRRIVTRDEFARMSRTAPDILSLDAFRVDQDRTPEQGANDPNDR